MGVPDGLENFYNVLGGSGHGFKKVPAFDESVAQSVLGESPTIEIEAYRLSWFEEGAALYGVSTKSHGGDSG